MDILSVLFHTWIVCYSSKLMSENKNIKYFLKFAENMAEVSMAVFGAVAGVAIILAIVCFVIRGKGHHDNIPHVTRPQD